MSSLQRYLDNVVAEDSWGHPNWNEWAATLFDELVSCVESLEERVETLTEAHDAAQPELAQTYGDKRGTYAEQPAEPSDGWLAECAEDWWVHQHGSTDTNRSRWALQYADRLIAAAREGAMQTLQAYEQIVQLNKSLAAKEADLATSKEKLAAATKQADGLKANLAVCDGLKARLEQTTALLIEECDETTKLRADLAAANAKLEQTNALPIAECDETTNLTRENTRLRDLLAAANAKAERLERERALPANAQAEKDLRKAEDILANVVDCIRGRITHRDPRDKREQLLWFASELKRAAEEIGGLLEERW